MSKICLLLFILLSIQKISSAQVSKNLKVDTAVVVATKGKFSTEEFIKLVREDTSFYKAFQNLHYFPYRIIAALAVMDKDNDEHASMYRVAHQYVKNKRKWMVKDEEKVNGKIFKHNGKFNFYTAELLDHIFFPRDTDVATDDISDFRNQMKGKGENDKNKEKLKMLMFNPGATVSGVPMIGNKLAIFDDDMIKYYNYKVELADYADSLRCYKFSVIAKDPNDDHAVIKELISYFDRKTFNIVARRYVTSYHSAPFDFDVTIEVRIDNSKVAPVPIAISYNGFWNVVLKKAEYVNFQIKFDEFDFRK